MRTLYDCFNARVLGKVIFCSKGYILGRAKDGTIPVVKLERGSPLEIGVCQDCRDFDQMDGGVVEDRGW